MTRSVRGLSATPVSCRSVRRRSSQDGAEMNGSLCNSPCMAARSETPPVAHRRGGDDLVRTAHRQTRVFGVRPLPAQGHWPV
jgi:hypothetical protein